MDDCIFCTLAKNPSKGNAVYEDKVCFALLDPKPVVKGQVLIVPKEHVMILPQASDEFVAHLAKVAQRVSRSLIVMLKCHGTTTLFNSGIEAGQNAQHFTVSVLPRDADDGLNFSSRGRAMSTVDRDELIKVMEDKVGEFLGK